MVIWNPQLSPSMIVLLAYGDFFFTIYEVSKSETEM